ncbi:MAG: sigma-70 family RNA polymerase sigma factor [Candidatus Poribacteria bacterium]|nr:sigma-70 family RNA polymerase sigma factor [Candidatus Poribacteria bacterium]
MKKKDVELIQLTLDGDQSAFTALVEKYQKGVHVLVWQKIGDFHIAQEITQDAFLRAYQKLSTLKNHKLFSGWLYVIATRLCSEWLRKKRLPIQSIDTIDNTEVDQMAYKQYIQTEREDDAKEKQRELVRKLLKKLPESERTVMTLHYLGEMKCETISEFIGVSPNTVRSRLSRARNRLKKDESMIKENLSSFQLPTQLTETIMEKISQLNPVSPSGSRPLVPLAVSAVSALFVVLLMGVGAQNLFRFQKPYQLDAQSEPTIEIMETQLVIDTPAKPAVRAQIGSVNVPSNSNGGGQESDTRLLAAAQVDENEIAKPKRQWSDAKGPQGGNVSTLFTTTRGDLYAGTEHGIYRLTDDRTSWRLVKNIKSPPSVGLFSKIKWWPLVEHKDTLYLAYDKEILASSDRGETWNIFCECIKGELIGMVVTDGIHGAQFDIDIYLAYTNGVFHTDNAGKSWTPLPEGLADRKIKAIAAMENTIFVGTDKGLYRLSSDKWMQIPINHKESRDKTPVIVKLAVTENHLYVIAQVGWRDSIIVPNIKSNKPEGQNNVYVSLDYQPPPWVLYRSTDLGESWNSITPIEITPIEDYVEKILDEFSVNSDTDPQVKKDEEPSVGITHSIISTEKVWEQITHNINVSGETVMLIIGENNFYSNDAGETWISLADEYEIGKPSDAVMLNETTFFRSGTLGILRSTDSGESWHPLISGLVDTNVIQLIVLNGILYAKTESKFMYSIDGGESWIPFSSDISKPINIVESNGELYASKSKEGITGFYQLSSEGNKFTEITDIPALEIVPDLNKNQFPNGTLVFWQNKNRFLHIVSDLGSFAVTDKALYVAYNTELLRWNIGALNWYNTGLKEIVQPDNLIVNTNSRISYRKDFKFAVSGNSVYVEKRDGHLMHSSDGGNTWKDVSEFLPFSVEHFISIVFAGNFVYVATDKGVLLSGNGTDWHTLTDVEEIPLVMRILVVDDTTVYGESKQKIYQLNKNSGKWQQVTPKIPYYVNCFDVDDKTIYVGTFGQGVLRYALDE